MTVRKSANGFTLIELLVVISIIGILSTIGIMTYLGSQQKARDAERKSDLKQIQNALQQYQNDHNAFPTGTINSTQAGWSTFLSTSYIKKMPVDPANTSAHNYAYKDANSFCPAITAGTDYVLSVKLENTSDSSVATAHTLTIDNGCTYTTAVGEYALYNP